MRFIDANELLKTNKRLLEHAEMNGMYNHARIYERFVNSIEEMPTADVVPKSEVERLKIAYEGSQKTIEGLTEMIREKNHELSVIETHHQLHHGEISLNKFIAEEKRQLAREIFAEIERFLYVHFRFCKEEIGNDDTEYVKGRMELNTQMQDFIAELKKKYTEQKNG